MTQENEGFNEVQLVEAARNGCIDSFAALYKKYHSPMVALAYSILAGRDRAEDVAQETFAIACRDLPTLKSKDKFAAWLAGICRNLSKQMLRAARSERNLTPDEPVVHTKDRTDERSEAIRQAVWNLRAAERELIVLRYFDGFSQAQISSVLGISPQAVNGRLVRAKRKIAEYLKRNGLTGVHYESAR